MAVLLILSVWLVAGTALCGCGLLAARALKIPAGGSVSRSFWLGWAAVLGVLCSVCLVHAVDGTVEVLFLCAGAAGFAIAPDARRKWWQRLRAEWHWIAVLAPVAVWLADRARFEPQNGDSYLYHLQAVDWAEAFAATPGLANLHDRLGFNNSSTLFLALLDHWPMDSRATHVANGLLLLPLFGRGLRALARLTRIGTARDGLDAFLLVPAVDWALGMNLSSASPDLPLACMEAAIASELAIKSPHIGALVVMGAALLTLKLSGVGFALGLAVAITMFLRRTTNEKIYRRVYIASLLLIAAWMARGIVLCGYPFYPNPLGGLAVDWSVPLERAREQYGYTLAWGRRPGQPWRDVLASWDWLTPWAKSILKLTRDVVIPVSIAAALPVVSAIVRPRKSAASRLPALLFLPPIIALIVWFATSPDLRFAGACFWLLPSASAAFLASRGLKGPVAFMIPAIVLALAIWPFTTPYNHFGPIKSGFRDSAPARTKKFTTHSGLELSTPASGSGCYGRDLLLCAMRPNEDIRLREPGNVAAGFSVVK